MRKSLVKPKKKKKYPERKNPQAEPAEGKESLLWQEDGHIVNLQVIKVLEKQQSQTDQCGVAQLEVCADVKRSRSIKAWTESLRTWVTS